MSERQKQRNILRWWWALWSKRVGRRSGRDGHGSSMPPTAPLRPDLPRHETLWDLFLLEEWEEEPWDIDDNRR